LESSLQNIPLQHSALYGRSEIFQLHTEGALDKSMFDPSDAKINFAVPTISRLEIDKEQEELKPGILYNTAASRLRHLQRSRNI
jgi:hypothetical protein